MPRFRRHFPGRSPRPLSSASVSSHCSSISACSGLLFRVRAGEGVVLPGIVLGLLIGALWRMSAVNDRWGRWLASRWRRSPSCCSLRTPWSWRVSRVNGSRGSPVAGPRSTVRAARARKSASDSGRTRQSSIGAIAIPRSRFASPAYARECVAPGDRILVLWFAPEIYYYSNRLMAGRHVFFLPALRTLSDEQRMEMEKLRRFPPQLVFARVSDRSAGEAFPEMVDLLVQDFTLAGSVDDAGERYLILARSDRVPVRSYGNHGWPCYR